MRNVCTLVAMGLVLAAVSTPSMARDNPQILRGDWTSAGADIRDSHSQFNEIILNRYDVRYLAPRWVFSTSGTVVATPAVVGRSLYVPDNSGSLYRIDVLTGHVVWQKKIQDYSGSAASYSRTTPAISGSTLVIGDRTSATVFAIDRYSGALLWKQQLDTAPGALITGSAVIADGRVYVGVSSNQESLAVTKGFVLSFRGQVAALDLASGKIIWQFRTVPAGYTGGAVWSSHSAVDLRRDSLYVSVGNNYSVPTSVSKCQANAATIVEKDACASPDDHYDSILALSLGTGRLKWSRTLEGPDSWTVDCVVNAPVGAPCADPVGPDYDFGSGPNLFTIGSWGHTTDLVGIGQKSGVYWAANADDGHIVWATQVGPGGGLGGILWGTATDTHQIYTGIGNNNHVTTALQPSGVKATGGFWSALDAATGTIRWQTPAIGQDPQVPASTATAPGSVSIANGVLYGEDSSGYLAAMDARTGAVLWKFHAVGSPVNGPAISDASLYWGVKTKLYAFGLFGHL